MLWILQTWASREVLVNVSASDAHNTSSTNNIQITHTQKNLIQKVCKIMQMIHRKFILLLLNIENCYVVVFLAAFVDENFIVSVDWVYISSTFFLWTNKWKFSENVWTTTKWLSVCWKFKVSESKRKIPETEKKLQQTSLNFHHFQFYFCSILTFFIHLFTLLYFFLIHYLI